MEIASPYRDKMRARNDDPLVLLGPSAGLDSLQVSRAEDVHVVLDATPNVKVQSTEAEVV